MHLARRLARLLVAAAMSMFAFTLWGGSAAAGRLCAVAVKKVPGTPARMCVGYVAEAGAPLECGYYRYEFRRCS